VIRPFKDKLTETVASGKYPKGFPPGLVRSAVRKLMLIAAAHVLDDLRSPPGNRLETLKSDRDGQHSIWINDQWRICFV
jgi:proteic killer suppression protein